jgi:HSP20 family protein
MAEKRSEEKKEGQSEQKKEAKQPQQQRAMERKEPQAGAGRQLARQPMPGMLSPFGMMRGLIEDMDRLFSEWGMPLSTTMLGTGPGRLARLGAWAPEIEAFEEDGKLVVRADLPGMSEKDVNVEIRGRSLIISGERRQEREEERGGVYRTERSYGSFQREIELPEEVDPERVEAKLQNGVLELTVPLEAAKRKRIMVRGEERAEAGGEREAQPGAGEAEQPGAEGESAEHPPIH